MFCLNNYFCTNLLFYLKKKIMKDSLFIKLANLLVFKYGYISCYYSLDNSEYVIKVLEPVLIDSFFKSIISLLNSVKYTVVSRGNNIFFEF